MIKIVFFDIDGTLLSFGEPDISESTRNALGILKEKGVKLFLATGRRPGGIPEFTGVEFDGTISFNGGYCFTGNKAGNKVIYSDHIPKEDVYRVVENAKSIGLSVILATDRNYGCNFYEKNLDDYMMISKSGCNITDEFDDFLNDNIYQMMIGSVAEQDDIILEGTKSVKLARWWERAVDVIPASSGKAAAIKEVLKYYGFSAEECMAFGDGGNDIDMIKFAGIGVAMGNSDEEVKMAADHVTDTCDNDGIYKAFKYFKMI